MLTGAARRGAASVGSLLIAAVPSSPIESDGFPTSSWCGARRRRLLAGGVLRVGMFAVLFAFGVLWGVAMGGLPQTGRLDEARRQSGCLYVFRGVLFGAVSEVQHAVIEYKRTKRRVG